VVQGEKGCQMLVLITIALYITVLVF